jgi:hypothetical protein
MNETDAINKLVKLVRDDFYRYLPIADRKVVKAGSIEHVLLVAEGWREGSEEIVAVDTGSGIQFSVMLIMSGGSSVQAESQKILAAHGIDWNLAEKGLASMMEDDGA